MNSTFSTEIANNPDLMHVVFESLPEPTFLIDKSGTYVEAWGGRDRKRHHDPAAVIGLNQYQVLPSDKAIWFSQVIVDVIDSQTAAELEYALDPKELPCFEGTEGPQQVQHFSALVIPLPNTSLVLWTVRNITEFKLALDKLAVQQIELERLTYIDHLTQIYNRYALDVLLPEAIEVAKLKLIGSAVLMIDIDCFKEYNDHFGHLQGDEILKTLSHAIRTWAKGDDLCFRYGGDEFLVFIPNVTESESLAHAQTLQEQVRQLAIPHPSSTVGELLSITIGIQHCRIVPQEMDAEKFISIADKALFNAKGRQRGSIHQLSENGKAPD
ncbi:diguanylate cyclase [Vibrio galatheae]|uniref:diguanylate cyclase n=1 Tax=Vibrio galatheae TaxID=579748 RepID=A0A0F4NPW8_9VIBR|nr:GGDEF domain-containing protein [Vibrio galatheae]KJY85162.1 diguanylate cyclase [Vibrio galatheae]